MRGILVLLLILLCSLPASAQGNLIINKYAAIQGRLTCTNTFSVDTATGFGAGDTVLMIQMKGATIDSSNTAAFGNIVSLNGAGNYEYNVVKSVAGNNITLVYSVKRQYDIPNGKVQFVRVPHFSNYTVATQQTCLPWTGTKGGVYALDASGTIALNNSIDVSGRGFRGAINLVVASPNVICNITDYFLPPNIDSGGIKGEGITNISLAKSCGRGKLATGGGGADAHNAGGGGGSNAGSGGIGGYQYYGCVATPTVNISGGIGGQALQYSNATNRIFLGGGGGTGQENTNTDVSGGNGGGIIIISAGTITGNSAQIIASGSDAKGCINNGTYGNCHDGMGGGGGAGAILLKASSYTGSISVLAVGGKGADENADPVYNQVGPGGGGGGGTVWASNASISPNVTVNTAGGANGIVGYNGTNWGAQPGNAGTTLTGLQLLFPTTADSFRLNISVAFSDSSAGCFKRKFINGTTTIMTGIADYSWDFGNGNTSTLTNPTFTFPGNGTYPVKLVVVDSNGCKDSLIKNIIINVPRFVKAGNDTTTCLGVAVMLHASGAASYTWQPDVTLSGSLNTSNVLAKPTGLSTAYIVEGTDANGCLDRDTVVVTLVPGAVVVASPHQLSNCKGKAVQLSASGVTSYLWSPDTSLSATNIANPVATVTGNITYIVTGKDAKGCLSFDTVYVVVAPGPVVMASADGNGVSCYARAIQLHATGALAYEWHPGAYLNDSTIAAPTATPARTTTFTVIGRDAQGCTGSDTITVASYATAVVFLPNAFTPNGDHLNDDIRPVIFCDFKLDKWEVFNRWGQSVYQGYNLYKGWDGTVKGEPAPMDVYMYYVRGKNDMGELVFYKGNISLLR